MKMGISAMVRGITKLMVHINFICVIMRGGGVLMCVIVLYLCNKLCIGDMLSMYVSLRIAVVIMVDCNLTSKLI